MTPLQKLRIDTVRYLEFRSQYGACTRFQLLFIVDYWMVVFHRLQEQVSVSPPGIRHALLILTWILKPIVEGLTGARIRAGVSIGPGLVVVNSFGVLVASNAVIGDDCTVHSGAFVASKVNDKGEGVPVLGNRVVLMNGCKVLGGVKVGDDAIICANSVVISDVPAGSLAAGVPAQISARDRFKQRDVYVCS